MSSHVKYFICKNPNSKFATIFNSSVNNGLQKIGIVFYPDSEKCFWPIQSSMFELLSEGWVEVNE